MKILILHLSDLHIKDNTHTKDEVINPIVSVLQELPSFDKAILVISGDVAYSGKKEEYAHAVHFIGKIIQKLKKNYFEQNQQIDTIVVPGNHDIDFKNTQRSRSFIKSAINNGSIETIITEDISSMSNFFNFAKYNRCFLAKKTTDKITLEYDGYRIQFNLINSAPLSAFKDPTGDNEQSLHYINPEEINALSSTDGANICFTVIHHGFDWYDYNSRQLLENKLVESSSIVFLGHDHIQSSEFRNIDGSTECIFMKGGIISANNTVCEFNCVILDTDKNSFTTFDCKSDTGTIYSLQKQQDISLDRKLSRNGFHVKKEFFSQLNSADFNGMRIDDMFVFPSLLQVTEDFSEKQKPIESYEDLIKVIGESSLCIIEGSDLSGKTQLLKYIYSKIFESKLPLLIDADNIIKRSTVNTIIKNAFFEQFSSSENDYNKYSQMDKTKKVILIDNINRVKDIQSFLKELSEKYSLVICTTSPSSNTDVKETIISEITESNVVCKLRIEKFYFEKRNLLIKKACDSLFPDISEKSKLDKVKEINNFIIEQLKLFDISPYFILSFCANYAKRTKGDGNDLNVFGEVFKANLVKAFESNSDIRVDTAFFVLGELAFQIMLGREYPLSFSTFSSIIQDYNINYGNKINSAIFVKNLMDAKIIKPYGDDYIKFYSTNILAYFAGKKIAENKDTAAGKELIRYLIKNICFGINSEVIRFVIASNNDVNLLNMLIDEINYYFNDLEEFSFEKNNLSYLCKSVSKMKLQAPNSVDKKKEVTRIDSQERRMLSKKIDVLDIFDYDDKDLEKFSNKQIRLQRLSILTSSLYANFYHIILASDKNKYVEAIFTQPNKILFFMLSPFDKDFSKMIDEIYQDVKVNNEKITKEMIAELFIHISETLMLNVLDCTARNCGTNETIDSLGKYVENNNSINNRIILTMIHENMGHLKTFGEMAERIDDGTSIPIISNMIKRIVYKHFLWNKVSLVGYGQHLADRYFSNDRKKIKSIRNRTISNKK